MASYYKDANVPVEKFRLRGRDMRNGEGGSDVVEESWWMARRMRKGGFGRAWKYVAGANGPLNGLGGSKHCQREEINRKLVADNPPSVLCS